MFLRTVIVFQAAGKVIPDGFESEIIIFTSHNEQVLSGSRETISLAYFSPRNMFECGFWFGSGVL